MPRGVNTLLFKQRISMAQPPRSSGRIIPRYMPLMIRITYRDVYDSEAEWVQGFYVQNSDGGPTARGMLIPRDRWYPYESGNLLESLPVRPYKIMRVRVYASGWDYDSLVSDINLIVD